MWQRTAYLNVVLAAMLLLLGCGDSGPDEDEPGTAGPEFVTMTRDGKAWKPETSGFLMLGTGASFGWERQIVGTAKREGVSFLIRGFTGAGDYSLSEGPTENLASFGVSDYSTNSGLHFGTTSAHPGNLRISGFDPADSTIAGNFRFEIHFPDGSRTSFAGVFRLRHPCC